MRLTEGERRHGEKAGIVEERPVRQRKGDDNEEQAEGGEDEDIARGADA